jgi:hypothetical protein
MVSVAISAQGVLPLVLVADVVEVDISPPFIPLLSSGELLASVA